MISAVSNPSGVQHAPTFAEGGAKQQKDASSATELCELAMREQLRREQQRRRMVKWRKQKKEKKTDMVEERRRLEKKLQRHVMAVRVASDTLTTQSTAEAYRQATIECAALTSENVALKEAIEEKVKLKQLMEQETQEFLDEIGSDYSLQTPMDDDAWRVQFPGGAPSFYFTPFTKEEYDGILNGNSVLYAERHPCTATVGKILGWTVDYAPLARTETGNSFMAHARFTRRVRCSLDASEMILPHLDKNLWPLLVAPHSWGQIQSGSFCCQTLQSFHTNAHVLACNIPGQCHLRYLALARHTREKTLDGKRVDKYVLTVADTEANRRNRETDRLQENVQWILEGGIYTTITEVDDSTIDVVVDQWSGCLSEVHGRELYIDWIRFPVCLEQYISPARLICQ